jgi:small subunit ribosomal protein S8
MLTRIRNAQAVGKEQVLVPFSRMKFRIAELLSVAGYLAGVERRKRKSGRTEHEMLALTLKYVSAGAGEETRMGAISGLRMVSKPSRRIYVGTEELKPVRSGYGLAVVSTSKGVMTSKDARREKVGGELMFEVW